MPLLMMLLAAAGADRLHCDGFEPVQRSAPVRLAAEPTEVAPGQLTWLSWRVTPAISPFTCSLSAGDIIILDDFLLRSVSQAADAPHVDTTYTLSCRREHHDGYDDWTSQVRVTVTVAGKRLCG